MAWQWFPILFQFSVFVCSVLLFEWRRWSWHERSHCIWAFIVIQTNVNIIYVEYILFVLRRWFVSATIGNYIYVCQCGSSNISVGRSVRARELPNGWWRSGLADRFHLRVIQVAIFFSSSCWCGMHSTAAHTPTSHVHPRTVCAVGITMLHGLLGAELMFYLAREAYNVTHLDQKQCQHFFLLLQFGCCLARPSCSGEIPSTICWHSVWRNFVVLRHFPMLITACYSLQLKCTAPSHTHTHSVHNNDIRVAASCPPCDKTDFYIYSFSDKWCQYFMLRTIHYSCLFFALFAAYFVCVFLCILFACLINWK